MASDHSSDPPHRLNPDWHYHFLGIGGVGMSALAEILHRRGIRVSGSDSQGGPVLEALRRSGIGAETGHRPDHLANADAVVYSSALGADHPIWAEVERLGLPRLHRAELLGGLAAERRTLAVTGTHGKTTTTAALGHALAACGQDPTVLVGGHVPQLQGRNWRLGEGPWLVCEADESDASFLHLNPEAVLLTNVEADHLDFHGSLDNLHAAFAAFLARMPGDGRLIYCADDPGAVALAQAWGARATGYGADAPAEFRVTVDAMGAEGMRLALHHGERSWPLNSRLFGRHNALNLCGAFAMGRVLGLPDDSLLTALGDFTGVERRQQFLGKTSGLAIYDDYAHHPTEIRATLEGFLAVHGPPLTVVFQPHLYSRTAAFAREFAEALRPATRIYVTEVYGAREAPRPGVSGRMIVDHLRGHPAAGFVADWRALAGKLLEGGADAPGLVLILGAGDITGLGPALLREES